MTSALHRTQFFVLLQFVAAQYGCDHFDSSPDGCGLDCDTCGSCLFDGPSDADIEIKLSGLPKSTTSVPVYIYWWAATKSSTAYTLASIDDAYLYERSSLAYPTFTGTGRNSGGALVGEDGTVTLKMYWPSRYEARKRGTLVEPCPHVHLKICGGSKRARNEKLIFSDNSVYPKSCGGWKTNKITVVSVASGNVTLETTDPDVDDYDALEFSPVFQCLLDGKLYSQTKSECTSSCASDEVMFRAQCLRPQLSYRSMQTFSSQWKLNGSCGDACFDDKVPVTLHYIRIVVANVLMINFQAVQIVRLRRDNEEPELYTYLRVEVQTSLITSSEGADLLRQVWDAVPDLSVILGFNVNGTQLLDSWNSSKFETTEQRGETDDVFTSYYEPYEEGAEAGAWGRVEEKLDDVPDWAWVLIAVLAIIILVMVIVLVVLCIKKKLATVTVTEKLATKKVDDDIAPSAAPVTEPVQTNDAENRNAPHV